MADRIKHERILLSRRARVWRGTEEQAQFELFCNSRDLSISGIFLNSLALMRIGTDVRVDLEVSDNEWLPLNGHVARRIELEDREHHPGFAVKFGELSDRSHETLLRYFVTEKIEKYVGIFHQRFPHLDGVVSEQDIALIVNLWEDHRHLLVDDKGEEAPVRHAPRTFGGPARGIAATKAAAAARGVAPVAPIQTPFVVKHDRTAPKPVAIARPAPVSVRPIAAPAPRPAPLPVKAPVPVAKAAPPPAKPAAPAAKAPVPTKAPAPAAKPAPVVAKAPVKAAAPPPKPAAKAAPEQAKKPKRK